MASQQGSQVPNPGPNPFQTAVGIQHVYVIIGKFHFCRLLYVLTHVNLKVITAMNKIII